MLFFYTKYLIINVLFLVQILELIYKHKQNENKNFLSNSISNEH